MALGIVIGIGIAVLAVAVIGYYTFGKDFWKLF